MAALHGVHSPILSIRPSFATTTGARSIMALLLTSLMTPSSLFILYTRSPSPSPSLSSPTVAGAPSWCCF